MSNNKDNKNSYLQMFRQMVRIRAFEEQANQLYLSAKMPGLTHMYVGQEAVAVGICEALTPNDKITSTHRGHGHCVAKGADFKQMFCELLGKQEGYCRGKGGSMHIADQANGNLGANAIVGGSAGIATGAALTAKRMGKKEVSVCFFGDGALGQGLLYETMNMAALWKLPVIFVIENNQYAMGTAQERSTSSPEIYTRGEAFGIKGEAVDGMDVIAVKTAGDKAADYCRAGKGPYILEIKTYRYRGHSMSDPAKYRTREEVQKMRAQRDPIEAVRTLLISEKHATDEEIKTIDKEIKEIINACAEYAKDSPEVSAEELWTDVYA